MRTVLEVARHDWRVLAADRTLLRLGLALAAVVGYAVWNGAAWSQAQAAERALVRSGEAELMASLRAPVETGLDPGPSGPFSEDPFSPRYLAGREQSAFLEPTPLAGLAVGQGDLLPGRVGVTLFTDRQSLARRYELANPLNLLAGRFDLAFAVVYAFPLLILALSYDLLSGEREAGTLALAASLPVRLSTLVWGKLIARFAVVVGLGAGFSLLGALLTGVSLGDPEALVRLALWTAVVTGYGAFWFALAVAVTALGRGSVANAVALAGAWLALAVVVPALLNLAVTTVYPVPSRVALIHASREATSEIEERGAQVLERWYQDHPELSPEGGDPDLNDFTTRYYTLKQAVAGRVEPLLDAHESQLRRQQALVGLARFVSPAVVAQQALADVAGTGEARHRGFLQQAWAFAREWQAFFVPRLFRGERLTAADYEALPRFAFREEPLWRLVARTAAAALGILVPAALLAGWGLAGLRRYRPVAESA